MLWREGLVGLSGALVLWCLSPMALLPRCPDITLPNGANGPNGFCLRSLQELNPWQELGREGKDRDNSE